MKICNFLLRATHGHMKYSIMDFASNSSEYINELFNRMTIEEFTSDSININFA